MHQTRDLLLWLLVSLGVVPLAAKGRLLECVNGLARLETEHLLSDGRSKVRATSSR